jgi:heterodisulfide reductase subunit A-like polyferredoxin
MKKEPYWLDSAKSKSFPALNRNVSVDVLVIGAGVTGITAGICLNRVA